MKTVNRLNRNTGLVTTVAITMLLLRCTFSITPDNTGGNTSTVDNKVCGVIRDASGKPAKNTAVVMRPNDYLHQENMLGKRRAGEAAFVCSTLTDTHGAFRFTTRDSIPAGIYSIEARDTSGNCLFIQGIQIDSALLTSNTWLNVESPDEEIKLSPPGTISGTVPSFADAVSGMVYVYGLDRYAPIKPDGGFVLDNLPAGDLRLRIVAVENETVIDDAVTITTRPAETTAVPPLSDTAAAEVDVTRAFQAIDGFGASSAWIGSKITSELADIFWKDDTINGHIGLSLLRTRITERGYAVSEADPMKMAIQVNPEIRIWSTSWLPPEQLRNSSVNGEQFNSDSASMQGFADFLVTYVQDVKINLGIDLYAVSCQNEPDTVTPGAEGCLWTGEQFRIFLKDFWGPAFEKAGIIARRMIGESVKNDLALTDPSLTDTASARYADIIGTHLYDGGPYPYPLADSLEKPYWATEVSSLKSMDTSIANAVMWADRIHDCLVKCNMSAFHYWWLVNYGVSDDDEGLCNANGQPTPRMYALGNFSKFIRPGFVRVSATDSPAAGVRMSAYYGQSPDRLVIVAINSSALMTLDISIPGVPAGATVVPWITDATHRLERQQPLLLSGTRLISTLPARSVVTFVIDNVTVTP